MRSLSLLILPLILVGCTYASITPLKMADPISADKCNVEIFSSREAATEGGKQLIERCRVDAVPCPGFNKSSGAAIDCGKPKICQCGADKAYIVTTREQGFWDSGAATMVGFSYKSN